MKFTKKQIEAYQAEGNPLTTPLYWDCECAENYIHSKAKIECNECGRCPDEQPDSRLDEVIALGFDREKTK